MFSGLKIGPSTQIPGFQAAMDPLQFTETKTPSEAADVLGEFLGQPSNGTFCKSHHPPPCTSHRFGNASPWHVQDPSVGSECWGVVVFTNMGKPKMTGKLDHIFKRDP